MDAYLGIGGFPGLDTNPFTHIRRYAARHKGVGIALGDIGHDATAALIRDGRIEFAAEEERFNRLKHCMGIPQLAAEAARAFAGLDGAPTHAAYYMNPDDAHKQQRMESCRRYVRPELVAAIGDEFEEVQKFVGCVRREWPHLVPIDHHRAHAASAFYCSGFDRALVVVVDGQGEAVSTTVMLGDERGLHPVAEAPVTSSLGILYAALTAYLGFEPIEDEYKIMGLAAYGTSDEYRSFFDTVIKPQDDGGFSIPALLASPIDRMDEWDHALGAPRLSHDPIEPRHIAIAHSLQCAVERTMLRLLEHHERRLKTRHLCLAGGVALNCSMNGVIDRSGLFDRIFVQPAAGDPGAALGAALTSYYADHPNGPRQRLNDVYLGPSYSDAAVRQALDAFSDRIVWTRPNDYVDEVARLIADGRVVGWYQGRMEFGPRALGNRSILADPRRADMKDRVNQMVKKREEFRPFAPSVASEAADEFFALRSRDQYEFMTIAVKAKPERAAEIPAVVHVNGTSRVHVVRREVNRRYWELLTRFGERTGTALVLNTSFNIKGEPIVCTPVDAVRCFLGTGIDHLAIEGYLVSKPDGAVASA